jgi:four helix bundle protein
MTETKNTKQYDLEERTLEFARRCRVFIKMLHKTTSNLEDGKQLIRSSGSVGANYIEANESFSKKDFILRAKICRKETKESRYWLILVDTENNLGLDKERQTLIKEATELLNIFGAIIRKSE